jgi:hypothetical protein
MIRGLVLYAIYSPHYAALRNLAKAGFFVISSRMRQLIRLLQRVTDIHSSRRPLAFVKIEKNEKSRQNSDGKKNGNIVPKGFLPVYVGKDILTRFVIDVSVLNHPLFAELLEASVEEFGYEHRELSGFPVMSYCLRGSLISLTADIQRYQSLMNDFIGCYCFVMNLSKFH